VSEDELAIRALIDARVGALRAKDGAAAVATLADDFVGFELAPPLVAQNATDGAAAQAWLDGFQGPVEAEVRNLAVHFSGDVAFSHSLNRLSARRHDGRRVEFWMRSTLGFRKRADGWRIVHGHTSVPFRMDGSFTAAMDLEP
jgi:ketosteroid isomerase-like protein